MAYSKTSALDGGSAQADYAHPKTQNVNRLAVSRAIRSAGEVVPPPGYRQLTPLTDHFDALPGHNLADAVTRGSANAGGQRANL